MMLIEPELSEELKKGIKEKAEYDFYKEMLNVILEEWSVSLDRCRFMKIYSMWKIWEIIDRFERFSDDERTKQNIKTLSIFR